MADNEQRRLELLEEQVKLTRLLRASKDFQFFISEYLPNLTPKEVPAFHKDMESVLQSAVIKPEGADKYAGNRTLFIAPRGFAKSTVCSVMFPIWLALFGYRKDIFLVSATISLAKELLRKIKTEFESNDLLLKDAGEMKSNKWTEDHLVLKNGVNIRAKGRGFQIRGYRPDHIVCDDLEDEEVIYSKEQRDKMEHWFFRTLVPALKPDQSLLYVGTNLHQYSLINKLRVKDEFIVKEYKALTIVDGVQKSIWEDLWPTEALVHLRKEIGEYAFQAEYQNNPISLNEQPVKPHFLDGVKIGGERDVRCLAIDPAISEKTTADYRAFVMYDRTSEGFKPVHVSRGRWGIDEQVDIIIRLCEQYEPDRVIIEEVAYQKVFRQILLKKSREKNIYIPVSEAALGMSRDGTDKRPKDKLTRLMQIVHLFEQKLVEVSDMELREELLAFPYGDYDDLVDATTYCLYFLMKYRTGGVKNVAPMEKIVNGKPSYFVKEVRPGVFLAESGTPPMQNPRSNFINLNK